MYSQQFLIKDTDMALLASARPLAPKYQDQV